VTGETLQNAGGIHLNRGCALCPGGLCRALEDAAIITASRNKAVTGIERLRKFNG
jgi:hypothetical protein